MENQDRTPHTPSHPMRRKDDRILTRGVEVKGISEEDKQEIYENIDRVVENNRIPITEELLTLSPRKKGAAFPVTINIIAILSVAAAFFLSARFFEQRQEALSLETEQYLSAEGKLIEQLKKESEEKLREKDQEIGKIQDELAELDRRSADLQANMESTIREREEELREELNEALEAERARLQEMGASAEDIEDRLARFEEERRQEFENTLNTFRAEAEAEIQAKQEELEQARALNRDFLARMNAEKAELEEELNRREEELSAEFEEEKAVLRQETSEARKKLAELSAESEKEQLFMDQLTSGYITIKEQINNENYTAALEAVGTLEDLLADPSTAALPGLARRKEAEQFIIDMLKQDIESKTYKDDVDTASMVRAAEALLAAQEIARRGTEAFEAGNRAGAEDYYRRALASLPTMDRAYRDLSEIRGEKNARLLTGGITGGQALIAEGRYSEALEQYRSAILSSDLTSPDLYGNAVRGMEEAMAGQRRALVAAKDREIADITEEQKQDLAALETELNTRITELEETVETLNQAILEKEEVLALNEEALAAAGEEYEARIEELETTHAEALAEKEAELEELSALHQETLAEREAEFEEQEAAREEESAALQEQIDILKSEIQAAGEEIAGLRAVKGVYEDLTADYITYKGKIDRLLSTDQRGQVQEAEDIYNRFLAGEADTMFPGIKSLSEDILDIRLRESRKDTLSEGRKEAFDDILLYTDYLSAGLTGGPAGSRDEISRIAREEPEYGDTIMSIQELVESAGGEAAEEEEALFRQSRFIGTISYIIGDKIVIERLISFEAQQGDTLLIKRKLRNGRDETLAEASISRITPQKVEALIQSLGGDEKPQVMDLVYLVTE